MGFVIVGVILIIIGLVLFFVQKSQKTKANCIKLAQSATTAELLQMSKAIASEIGGGSWRDYVKVGGTIQCDRPLISELKQQPCVYYTMTVTREYEETVTRTDSDGKSHQETQRGSETISSNRQFTPFWVQDQTGKVFVDPNDGDIETVKVLDEFRQEPAVGGLLSFGNFSLALGKQFLGGNRRTIGYRYTESILPLDRRVLVVGTASDASGEITLQKPTESDRKFIISLRSEEELTQATERNARNARYGMIGTMAIGVVLFLVGMIRR